jgi:hypothetical protein
MISSTYETFTFVLMRRLSMATTTHLPSKKQIVQLQPKKHTAYWILLSVMLIVLSSLVALELTAQPVATTALPAPSVPLAYDATGAMLNSIVYPTYPDRRVQSPAALYDATGAMLNAIVLSNQVRPVSRPLAYDATASMLNAIVLSNQVRPVSRPLAYDATGVMLNALVFSNQVRPAPRNLPYDATGAMLEAVVYPKYPE